MARRTIHLPESVDSLVLAMTLEGESYSGAVARLIQAGARSIRGRGRVSYAGTGDGPQDLGRLAEKYLRDLVRVR
jgi:ABC-type phosphonate transport system ATPase subunit